MVTQGYPTTPNHCHIEPLCKHRNNYIIDTGMKINPIKTKGAGHCSISIIMDNMEREFSYRIYID